MVPSGEAVKCAVGMRAFDPALEPSIDRQRGQGPHESGGNGIQPALEG